MNIEPIEWKISASFDDGSHMVTFPAINKGILLLKKPEMADIESLIGLVVAARDAQVQAALAEQEPDGRPALQLADLILSMDMATEKGQRARELARQVQERYDESPAELALREIASYLSIGGYNAPWVDADKYKAKIIEEIQALSNPAAQERAESVAPAVQTEREAFDAWVAQVKPRYWQAEAWQTEAWAMWQSINAALSATPPAPAQPAKPQNPHHDYLRAYWQDGFNGKPLGACTGDAPMRAHREGFEAACALTAQPSPEPSKPEQAEAPDSYESIWNALQRISTAAAMLPTFTVDHEGGIEAFTQNIVDAIDRIATLPPASAAGEQRTERFEKMDANGDMLISTITTDGTTRAALATKPQAEQEAQGVADRKGGV